MFETQWAETQWLDLLLTLAPGLGVAALLVVLLAVYAFGPGEADTENASRLKGSYVLPSVLIGFWYWLATPLVDWLDRGGVRPNHITLFSLYLATLSAVALGAGYFMVGCWLLIAAASCDLLDGLLARRTGSGSTAGAFLDSFADRVAEGIVFAGLAFYGAGGLLTWLAIWAMFASVLVSYARARGEALGVDCKVGLMQRPERLLVLIVTLFFAPVAAVFWEPGAAQPVYHVAVGGVGLLALSSTITAARRAAWIVGALGSEAPSENVQSDHADHAQAGHGQAGHRQAGHRQDEQGHEPFESNAGATP